MPPPGAEFSCFVEDPLDAFCSFLLFETNPIFILNLISQGLLLPEGIINFREFNVTCIQTQVIKSNIKIGYCREKKDINIEIVGLVYM